MFMRKITSVAAFAMVSVTTVSVTTVSVVMVSVVMVSVVVVPSGFAAADVPGKVAPRALCQAGNICLWEDPNYTGSLYVNEPATANREIEINDWDGDNEISSAISNGCRVVLWDGDLTAKGEGQGLTGGNEIGHEVPNLASYGSGWDNRTESLTITCN